MDKYLIRVTLWDSEDDERWVGINSLPFRPGLLLRLGAAGLVEIREGKIRAGDIRRIGKLFRLRDSLGVTLSGAAIILDLLDKIEALQAEVRQLKR